MSQNSHDEAAYSCLKLGVIKWNYHEKKRKRHLEMKNILIHVAPLYDDNQEHFWWIDEIYHWQCSAYQLNHYHFLLSNNSSINAI